MKRVKILYHTGKNNYLKFRANEYSNLCFFEGNAMEICFYKEKNKRMKPRNKVPEYIVLHKESNYFFEKNYYYEVSSRPIRTKKAFIRYYRKYIYPRRNIFKKGTQLVLCARWSGQQDMYIIF